MIVKGFKNWARRYLAVIAICLMMFSPVVVHAQLPPQARADLLQRQIASHVERSQLDEALDKISEYKELGLRIPPTIHLLEAKILFLKVENVDREGQQWLLAKETLDRWDSAKSTLDAFFRTANNEHSGYEEALTIYDAIETKRSAWIAERRLEVNDYGALIYNASKDAERYFTRISDTGGPSTDMTRGVYLPGARSSLLINGKPVTFLSDGNIAQIAQPTLAVGEVFIGDSTGVYRSVERGSGRSTTALDVLGRPGGRILLKHDGFVDSSSETVRNYMANLRLVLVNDDGRTQVFWRPSTSARSGSSADEIFLVNKGYLRPVDDNTFAVFLESTRPPGSIVFTGRRREIPRNLRIMTFRYSGELVASKTIPILGVERRYGVNSEGDIWALRWNLERGAGFGIDLIQLDKNLNEIGNFSLRDVADSVGNFGASPTLFPEFVINDVLFRSNPILIKALTLRPRFYSNFSNVRVNRALGIPSNSIQVLAISRLVDGSEVELLRIMPRNEFAALGLRLAGAKVVGRTNQEIAIATSWDFVLESGATRSAVYTTRLPVSSEN